MIKAEARTGEDFLQKILQIDDGARRIGEFAFGTNFGIQQFTKDILFDEKIGGTLKFPRKFIHSPPLEGRKNA